MKTLLGLIGILALIAALVGLAAVGDAMADSRLPHWIEGGE